MSYGIGKNLNLAIDKVNRRNGELYRLLLLATILKVDIQHYGFSM